MIISTLEALFFVTGANIFAYLVYVLVTRKHDKLARYNNLIFISSLLLMAASVVGYAVLETEMTKGEVSKSTTYYVTEYDEETHSLIGQSPTGHKTKQQIDESHLSTDVILNGVKYFEIQEYELDLKLLTLKAEKIALTGNRD